MDAVRWEKFEDPSHSPKRKKHSSIACSQCRKLKIKCQGGIPPAKGTDAASHPCSYCTLHGKRCDWPEEDGRKLKRQRSRSTSQSSGHAGTDRMASLALNETSAPRQLAVVDENREQKFQKPSGPARKEPQKAPESPSKAGNRESRRSSTSDTPYTTVHYYRHHGPTALAPGHKQVSLKARYDSSEFSQTQQKVPPDEPQILNQRVFGSSEPQLFDNSTSLPTAALLPTLLDTFFEYYGDLYCFLNQQHLQKLIDDGEPPVFLIVVMSALSSRFCDPEVFRNYFPPITGDLKRELWEFSTPFLEKAKSMVIAAINLPTTEGIAGLLLLAFADFGDNNEAGLWMYTGMAVRMAQEIGLQRRRSERRPSYQISGQDIEEAKKQMETVDPDDFQEAADVVLFWCVFALDVALCNGTGRVPSIKSHEMSVRYPTNLDVARVRAGPGGQTEPIKVEVYPQMAKIMLLVGESVDFLNTAASQLNQSNQQNGADRLSRLENIRMRMQRAYQSLPQEVASGANPYRSAVNAGQAGSYLLLHLQYHLQMAFLSQESLTELSEPTSKGPDENPEPVKRTTNDLYKSSIKAITDMLTIAKLIDDRPCVTVVYLNQAFFHASCAYCRDMIDEKDGERAGPNEPAPTAFPLPNETSPSMIMPPGANNLAQSTASEAAKKSTQSFIALVARANYQFLRQAIKEQHKVYAGAGWVDAVLDQREKGLRDADLSIVSDSISTFIRLHNLQDLVAAEEALQKYVPPPPETTEIRNNAIPEMSNIDWSNFSTELFTNAELNFDPQAFFMDYMFNEQANMGYG